ncbi:HesA/MoeB/ThiF family protein [Algihabitans albus]|uniref:HesA/MoeB/ThiF family protein n=1 Tax=Algihabitans albus TaxID=2164067 RepID=UPI000E5D8757|nr:molybdopterin-synthase adenylyltransferase MoeB [Algihabitans albus]
MDFSDSEIERYARHLVLPEIGEDGQAKLRSARVLVIGAGGLGAPLLMYLAAAGVGTLGLIDDDVVDLSNLQRQVIHGTGDVGRAKVESAAAAIGRINPEVTVEAHPARLTAQTALQLIESYNLVADGSDNFATRYLVNDACVLAGRTLVSAAIMRFDGQLSTFKPHVGEELPCYRCLFGDQPPRDPKMSCADVGVLGALPGTLGALQATEAVKELLGIGRSMAGRLLLYDALEASFREVRVKRDPVCRVCGPQADIVDLKPETYAPSQAAAE